MTGRDALSVAAIANPVASRCVHMNFISIAHPPASVVIHRILTKQQAIKLIRALRGLTDLTDSFLLTLH